ncbi:hypothetical protein ACHAPJ_010102 [Fusarium lateritium]
MADFQSFSTYSAAPTTTELFNRPDKTFVVNGQAEFLAVAIALEVPILSARNNVIASTNILSAGAGASFSVSASIDKLSLDENGDFLNSTSKVRSWIIEARKSQKFRRYVTKKIVTAQGVLDDSRQLAAVVNEIRILSSETVRDCNYIVSMLAISWSESPSVGRFWPQVLLEAADEGTLADYLSHTMINFKSQLDISMGICSALLFLHAHGVVHADLKPANVLVFTTTFDHEETRLLDRNGMVPITAKLCDFGYAVILDDYKSQQLFQARIGSDPWMAPELDAEEPIRLDDLHKADIYSFGLLTASIFMNGCTPFEHMTPEEISLVKTRAPDHESSAVTALMHSIKDMSSLNEYHEEFIQTFLTGTCAPSSSDRFSLIAIHHFLSLGFLQQPDRGEPDIPLAWFRDLREADGYMDALVALQRKHSVFGYLLDGPDVLDAQFRLREMRDSVNSIQRGSSGLEKQLENLFEATAPGPYSLRKFRRARRSDDIIGDSKAFVDLAEENYNQAIIKVPLFAFEHSFKASLLPRVARKEVLRDLRDTCDSGYNEEPAAPFHLAGAFFNGTIVEPSPDMGLKYLVKAAMLRNPDAVSFVLNVFDACSDVLPEDEKDQLLDQLLDIVKDYGSRAFGQSQQTLFNHIVPRDIKHDKVLAKIWSRRWPEEYSKDLASWRQAANIALSVLNNPFHLQAEPRTGHPEFDFDQLPLVNDESLDKFEITCKEEFKSEVTRLGCLNFCNGDGFTLLQVAAIKDDLGFAKVLVKDLGASVNTYGNTYGWTPLLLSCHCGHFEMAKFLVDNGADPTIKETLHKATILHSLNRFTDRQHCEEILNIALDAGVDINSPLEKGATPLHTTFSGWDYSRGVAAELLLEYGADPTRQAEELGSVFDFITPLAYATENLDVDLLERMIEASQDLISQTCVSVHQLNNAKAQAVSDLLVKTRFYCMSVGGSDYQSKLEAIMSMLIDDRVRACLIAQRGSSREPTDPFLTICSHGNACFMKAFLNLFPQTVVDNPDWGLPRTFLQVAIENGNTEMIHLLIQHGADLLTKDESGRTSFQTAAHYFPRILPELIQILEDLPMKKRQGKDIREVLEYQDNSGLTLFAQLLVEGYDDERQLAKSLHDKYRLKHDYKMRSDEDGMTFGNFILTASVTQGLVPIDTVQYLLQLDPPLEFTTNPAGKTLLTTAVQGFSGHQDSYDVPCHQITALLLGKYPEYERLMQTSDAEGHCILHVAALWSNKTALQMLKDHVRQHYPDESLPWNTLASGNSVLDVAMLGIKNMALAKFGTEVNKVAMRSTKKPALACYKFLRCVDISDPPSPGFTLIRKRVVDLVWRYDNFIIRLYCVRVSSQLKQALEQLDRWSKKRREKDEPLYHAYLGLPSGIQPFMKIEYEHCVPLTKDVVRWRRPGRIWTERERNGLRDQFEEWWNKGFGKAEEEYFARLDEGTVGN